MSKWILAMGTLLAAFLFTACESKKDQKALLVGLQSGYPPFEFIDKEGKVAGFDVDLAGLIAEKLGKQLVIKDMEFEAEILSLRQGSIDLILSGMNITPKRLQEIAMVPYHGNDVQNLSLIFWNTIPEGIHSLEDLKGATVSVQAGAVSAIYIQNFPEIQVKSFQGTSQPLMDVKYRKSAASLVEEEVALYLKSQHPEIKILQVPIPKGSIMGFGIGVKKENQELVSQVQQAINELKASGVMKKLEEKWFKEES